VVRAAADAVVDRGVEAIPALSARFPGRLRVDPFDPGTHVRRADQLGALVDTCFRMGIPGLDVAARHLDSRFPAHRFAAVLLFALTPDDRAIDLLRARIHDHEPRVRGLAVEALLPFVGHPRFETVLVHLRERLHSPMVEARRRAVSLLGVFRDVAAAPVLMGLLDDKNRELADEARRALRPITLQDHGARAKPWERWWQKAKKRSRVDWLIEGLMAGDRELRATAIVDLDQVAGTDFGYRPDAPPKARQACVEQFQAWWQEEQRRIEHTPE
jgi:HEAT repeat protein